MASYTDLMQQAANDHGLPVSVLTTIIANENSSQQYNPTSPTEVRGFAQITGATWTTANGPNVPYSTDPAAQLDTAAKLLSGYYANYGGDIALVAAAYNGGPGVANKAQALISQGVPEMDAILQATAACYPGNTGKVNEMSAYVSRATGSTNPNRSYGTQPTDNPVAINAIAALPVSGSLISADQLAAVNQVINPQAYNPVGVEGVTPWYSNSAIVNNGAPTKATPTPITFKVNFTKTGQPIPITIKLKASLQGFTKNLKHITNVDSTRTATLVHLWGMQADTITGHGSTGLFINQLGMSDFLSMSSINADTQKAILQGISNKVTFNGSNAVTITRPNAQGTIPGNITLTEDSMRMAAKDAFIELLSLFKVNGVVWFQGNENGDPTLKQVGADAWSLVTGSTSYQINASNNDVWTRGSVSMNFRNSTYFGYFKSLAFTMDAEKPFQWNFNFVFQVEKTITSSYYMPTNAQ